MFNVSIFMPRDVKWFRGIQGKVTEDMKIKMKKLREDGKTFREIAETFNVSCSTVQYHLSPRQKELTKKRAYERIKRLGPASQQYPERVRKYMREYQSDRYKSDPEYRERMLKHVRKYDAKKRIKLSKLN